MQLAAHSRAPQAQACSARSNDVAWCAAAALGGEKGHRADLQELCGTALWGRQQSTSNGSKCLLLPDAWSA